jgi:transposase
MPSQLSLGDRWRAVTLSEDAAWSSHRIAELIGCSHTTVLSLVQLHRTTGDVLPRPRSGRPRRLTPGASERLRLGQRSTPHATVNELRAYLRRTEHVSISSRSITRERHRLAFHRVREIIHRRLTAADKLRRRQWARDHVRDNWKHTAFCDEKQFVMNKTSNYVWVEQGEPPPRRDVHDPREQLMVWGAVWYHGRSTLSITTHNLDSQAYCEILGDHLLPTWPGGSRFRLLQDRAPIHKSRHTVDWLREWGVTWMEDWPSYSPDFNPMEFVWSWINHQVNGLRPTSLQTLQDAIQHVWDTIPQEIIQAYIDHFPHTLQRVIVAQGDRA